MSLLPAAYCFSTAHIVGRDGTPRLVTKPSTSNSRLENPEWGVRDLEDIAHLASTMGFELEQTHDMPANNLAVIFRKR